MRRVNQGDGPSTSTSTPTTTTPSTSTTTTTLPPPPAPTLTPYERALAGQAELVETICNDPTAPEGLCEDEIDSYSQLESMGDLGDPSIPEYQDPSYDSYDEEDPCNFGPC